jgi:hypothetical protein
MARIFGGTHSPRSGNSLVGDEDGTLFADPLRLLDLDWYHWWNSCEPEYLHRADLRPDYGTRMDTTDGRGVSWSQVSSDCILVQATRFTSSNVQSNV